MSKEVILDFTKVPRSHWVNSTLTYSEAGIINELDRSILREKRRVQKETHKNRKEGNPFQWSYTEWISVVETYQAAGYSREEAEWMADEGIPPDSELGMELIAKRSKRLEVYLEEFPGKSRERAIAELAKQLRVHNRKKGNIDDYIISESTVL